MATINLEKYTSPKTRSTTPAITKPGLKELLERDIRLFEKKFGAKEKEAFYSELGLLLSTGVNIKTAFEIIEEDIPHKKHRQLINSIKDDIIGGKRFYEALGQHKWFTVYEVQSIKIGEETGRLDEVLKELGAFFESVIKLRRQVSGMLAYPIVVSGLAIVIVYFMLCFVVPVFADIFRQTGRELPALTQFLIRLSERSSLIFYWVFGLLASGIILHRTQVRKNWYRKLTSAFFLKVPVINKLVQKIFLARFCQSMRLLAGSKVLINDALGLVKAMIGYYPIEQALDQVKQEVVKEGKLLNESLASYSIFPKKLVAMIRLSEEVNEPELIYDKLYKQYSAEIEHQQGVMAKLIEPLFIILLGFFVGFILVAMYLPMFEMSTGF